jgi:signal transduction histidine kinase
MKTNFIAVASHEMRTPLTVLRGHSEALLERLFGPLTEPQQRSLETCLSVVDRLTGTFNDLVEILRFDRREVTLNRSRFDLGEVVRETVAGIEPHAERRKLAVEVECDEPFLIDADREKLRLVLGNIVQNAVKFTPDGGRVEIGLIREGTLINLTVRDEGIGIEPGELDRIFDRFYTTADTTRHKSGKFEFATRGSGLGLSIAKSYVEAHGGTIRAESDGVGKGSCFRIRLPLAENEKTPAPVEDVREPATMR